MARKIPLERIAEWLKKSLQSLKDNDGQLPSRDVLRIVGESFDFSDYEQERYEKTGYVRWESMFHFFSIGLTKAGWIKKNKGVWYLTPEGEDAINLSPTNFLQTIDKKYKEWKIKNDKEQAVNEDDDEREEIVSGTAYEKAIDMARGEIDSFIKSMDPYEFQNLVAALLRGMGYYTPFIAPRGKDGGIDVIAYKDPLGSVPPRIKVQVKHRIDSKVNVKEVRELAGLLIKDGDTGLLVSTGGFTSDAEADIRSSNKHIEKIDLNDLISLWEDHYEKLGEEDQILLPIRKIAFLAPTE